MKSFQNQGKVSTNLQLKKIFISRWFLKNSLELSKLLRKTLATLKSTGFSLNMSIKLSPSWGKKFDVFEELTSETADWCSQDLKIILRAFSSLYLEILCSWKEWREIESILRSIYLRFQPNILVLWDQKVKSFSMRQTHLPVCYEGTFKFQRQNIKT